MIKTLPPLATVLDPTTTAVMVVDVQNDFCDPQEFPAAESMIPRLRALLSEMRGAGYPVVYTRAVHSEHTDSAVWRSRYSTRPHRSQTCREGTLGAEFHPEIAPEPGDAVVTKHRYNAFLRTNLELILRSKGIESIVFTGIATNVCVSTTAREAFCRDYWTTLVSDCMIAHSEAAHLQALEDARSGFGRVVTSEEVRAAASRLTAKHPSF
jgi:nicotinamidase-related amidase